MPLSPTSRAQEQIIKPAHLLKCGTPLSSFSNSAFLYSWGHGHRGWLPNELPKPLVIVMRTNLKSSPLTMSSQPPVRPLDFAASTLAITRSYVFQPDKSPWATSGGGDSRQGRCKAGARPVAERHCTGIEWALRQAWSALSSKSRVRQYTHSRPNTRCSSDRYRAEQMSHTLEPRPSEGFFSKFW
jgi:hypothetical protein